MENHFNLVDETWIPVSGVGRVSLSQIFSNPDYRALGGNPVQKIAMMKLLLAIAQAAAMPADDEEWRALGADGLADKCLVYLQKWHDRFYLYGEKPFLQMLAIASTAVQPFGAVQPQIAVGNKTVLTQWQVERTLENADKALLLIVLMGFALGGKNTDNRVTLSPGYAGKLNEKGKPSSGKPGPAVAHKGLLHSLLMGETIRQSLWLNLITQQQLNSNRHFPLGLGSPPWEEMPAGEDCRVARALKGSLIGRLVPLCRFCLLLEDGLHYSEGVAHSSYKEGRCDPTVAVNWSGKEPKALWCNPEKRPWRELTALLSFLSQQQSGGFECQQLQIGVQRAANAVEHFVLWSGGLGVSSNAGEQYVSGIDDFLESRLEIHSAALGDLWFAQLQLEMMALDELAKALYVRVFGYFKVQLVDSKLMAAHATQIFWQLCERDCQQLIDSCKPDDASQKARRQLRRRFASYAQQAYDQHCPKETARQLDAWAKCRPNFSKYLNQEV